MYISKNQTIARNPFLKTKKKKFEELLIGA